jgi:hypothetical protein
MASVPVCRSIVWRAGKRRTNRSHRKTRGARGLQPPRVKLRSLGFECGPEDILAAAQVETGWRQGAGRAYKPAFSGENHAS